MPAILRRLYRPDDKKKKRKKMDDDERRDGGLFGILGDLLRRKPEEDEASLKQKKQRQKKQQQQLLLDKQKAVKAQQKESSIIRQQELQPKQQARLNAKTNDWSLEVKKTPPVGNKKVEPIRPEPPNTVNNPLNAATSAASAATAAATKFVSNALQQFPYRGGSSAEQWVPVFSKTRLAPGEIVPVTIGGIDLIVVASKDGRKLYCMANSCPHLGTPLETGQLTRMPIENAINSNSNSIAYASSSAALTELEVTRLLSQDGCEDCIVCPLHKTCFSLQTGQVRGEWCPYPPILGKIVGALKGPTAAAVFDIRTRGKMIEVRINSTLQQQQPTTTPQLP
jgi:nitrite reductase/ring-hydroxylating ferredoxin subunit